MHTAELKALMFDGGNRYVVTSHILSIVSIISGRVCDNPESWCHICMKYSNKESRGSTFERLDALFN